MFRNDSEGRTVRVGRFFFDSTPPLAPLSSPSPPPPILTTTDLALPKVVRLRHKVFGRCEKTKKLRVPVVFDL